MMNERDWISSKEAKDILGVNSSRIRQLCINGNLRAEKRGRDWWIKVSSILDYANNQISDTNKAKKMKNIILNNLITTGNAPTVDSKLKEQVLKLRTIRQEYPETKLKDINGILEMIENDILDNK